jgi:hypothetical protein
MQAVVQEERTGCGIASVAAIAGVSYGKAAILAASIGIHATDPSLWSDTTYVRRLLTAYGMAAWPMEIPFSSWKGLPDCALLAIKWRLIAGKPHWHWVVFIRDHHGVRVLDSKVDLKHHCRSDFGRMHPKWFIPVQKMVIAMPPHRTWDASTVA